MPTLGTRTGMSTVSALAIGPLRAIGSSDSTRSTAPAGPAKVASAAAPVATSTALDAGAVPVDQNRVAAIRKAIETNSYPLTPAKIGDAMIAAGMLLRMPK